MAKLTCVMCGKDIDDNGTCLCSECRPQPVSDEEFEYWWEQSELREAEWENGVH